MRQVIVLAAVVLLCATVTGVAGADTYTFSGMWGSLGTGEGQFSTPLGIALDTDSSVYVADTNNGRIQVFSRDGTYLRQWPVPYSETAGSAWPVSIAINATGMVYVVDSQANTVQVFNRTGYRFFWFGGTGVQDGAFVTPVDVAVGQDGTVYVADAYNHRVQRFTADGTFLTRWGGFGTGNGSFILPHGVAVNSRGEVYVADWNNHRVQMFDADGTFLRAWGTEGAGEGEFQRPMRIAVDRQDSVFVDDSGLHNVQKFTADGTFLARWGYYGWNRPGVFNQPSGIAVAANGTVYVVDTGNERVQAFRREGGLPVITVPGGTEEPRDLDDDGRYEDVNGNTRKDFADVVLFFNQMTWIAVNEPVTAFDFNRPVESTSRTWSCSSTPSEPALSRGEGTGNPYHHLVVPCTAGIPSSSYRSPGSPSRPFGFHFRPVSGDGRTEDGWRLTRVTAMVPG